MKFFRILLLSLVFAAVAAFQVSAMDFAHRLSVENMTFQWRVEGQELHVGLKAETTSWVGVGFNPSSGMKDANFILSDFSAVCGSAVGCW